MTAASSQPPAKTAPATGFWLLPGGLRNFVRSRETGAGRGQHHDRPAQRVLVGIISELSEIAHGAAVRYSLSTLISAPPA